MCKDNRMNTGIRKLDFTKAKGKMIVYLTDGRELVIPVSFFPDIKKLPLEKRKEWMILDDQFFTFSHLSTVYSLSDLMRV